MRKKATSFLTAFLASSIIMILAPVHSLAAETVRVYVDPPQVVDENLIPGTSFYVAIKIDNVPASAGFAGAEWKLTWNTTVLNAVNMTEVMFHEVTPESEWDNIWQLEHEINNTAGFAGYAYSWLDFSRAIEKGYFPIVGNHTIATIAFRVKNMGNCTLHLTDSIMGAWNPDTGQIESIPHDLFDGYFSNLPPPGPKLLLYVDPPQVANQSIVLNSTFYVAVKSASIADHPGMVGVEFKLTWNSTLLDALNMTEVMFHEVTPVSEWDNIWSVKHLMNNTGGYLQYAYGFQDLNRAMNGSYAPIFGNHTLAIVEFRVKDIGNCTLHLTNCAVGDQNANPIECHAIDGFFSSVPPSILGDLNGDGKVDLRDAILLSRAYGTNPAHPRWNPDADINGDGAINILDAILLANNFGRKT